jgi:outer membrane protein assembly factor BamB
MHAMIGRLLAGLALATLLMAGVAADANWPQFRGPRAGVADDDPALPDSWSPTENIVWKLDIPGRAWSSPVIWGDHVFVTTASDTREPEPLKPVSSYTARSNGGPMSGQEVASSTDPYQWKVYDVDFRTGRIRWDRAVGTRVPSEPKHLKNSYASETPVTDGERVYAYFGNVGLFAFDMTGNPIWSKPMDVLKVRGGWGAAASPVIHGDRIYIVNDNDTRSFIAAYDRRTGAEIWRTDRDEGTNWTTPFVWQNAVRTEIVTAATRKVRSYDLDGRLLWELSGMTSIDIPTPFAADGLLYVESGYPPDSLRPVYAIRPGAAGDISLKSGETGNAFIVWAQPALGTFNTSALVVGGYFYALIDRGFLTCNDAKTGEVIYARQRITQDATSFTASPWAYNGKIFALSEDGDTYVIQAGREFRVLGKNSLNEMTLATPAVANGSLIVRTVSRLYRIGRTAGR